jgi:sterol desaturase/sphingolipid hydroxylase (fatty acid hydroxylase superfamily)
MAESPAGKKMAYMVHGVHHEYPRDKTRLFMPPLPSIFIAWVLFLLFDIALGDKVFAFFPGFLFGYLIYGSMHYAIHAFAPPRVLKALWRNHHLHHYKTPDKGFGVSSVLWDIVFGTMPEKEEA